MASQLPTAAGAQPVGADLLEEHHLDLDRGGGIDLGLHFVFHVAQFPKGIFWPICSCGWLPDDGFVTEDAARLVRCERQRRAMRAAVALAHGE